jgi:hypothetical protein
MRHVKNTHVFCQLFSKAFKQHNKLTVLTIAQSLQQCIIDIHTAGILVVDLNEMNALASQDLSEIYPIEIKKIRDPNLSHDMQL